MTGFPQDQLTCDAFLGGRLNLWQPRDGYRAGVDPVLLAASVPARSGQLVLDLGCGAGAAGLCLATRVPGLSLTGVEIQAEYADLARRNALANSAPLDVVTSDLSNLPAPLRQMRFDYVIANPPYFRAGAHTGAQDAGRRLALGGSGDLGDWVEVAARRLAPKGYLHMIQRVERLPEMMSACASRLGSLEVLPLAARVARAPDLVIMRARKGGRGDFVLHAPVILHEGATHTRDAESYAPQISAVLRDAQALGWSKK